MKRKHEENSIRERLSKKIKSVAVVSYPCPLCDGDNTITKPAFSQMADLVNHIIKDHKFKEILDYVD